MTTTLKPYRIAGVPMLAIQTADPAEILRQATKEVNATSPLLRWDCLHGLVGINQLGRGVAATLNNNMDAAMQTSNPTEMLRALEKLGQPALPANAVVVALGMADVIDDPQMKPVIRQALWNLRDCLSSRNTLLVMTVGMGWRNPLPDDIAVAIEALPTREYHQARAQMLAKGAGLNPTDDMLGMIADALLGLSGWSAEQVLAMSISPDGIDVNGVRSRKRQMIRETQGLGVYDGAERFDDLGGLAQVKKFFKDLLMGKRKPGCIVFIDEIEKALAGAGKDGSGTSDSVLGYILSYMQDNNVAGVLMVGPPGAAKSAMAKAVGNEGDIPTISLDVGGIKGSLVGETEARMRTALSVVTAVSGGRPLFIATCNSVSSLPPELRRRFTLGTFFFDLPTADERQTILDIYIRKYQLDPNQEMPAMEGWTGAEIRQMCDLADRLGRTLVEAAAFVVPVSVSAREKIESLRQEASGRYLSASADGRYIYEPNTVTTGTRTIANIE